MELKGSKTEQHLKDAFAGESQANRRYLYFAQKADVEGYNDVSAVFRSTAEGETGHAHGHLEHLESVGDPATGLPIGTTGDNLRAAIAGETHEYTDMYPGMAKTAREEGFDEIADWFETLAKAERSHANRFQRALDGLDGYGRAGRPSVRRRRSTPRRACERVMLNLRNQIRCCLYNIDL
jgi:rubrerythrin